MKLLMCAPNYYGIEYEINPWMDLQQQVKKEAAQQQWENLYQTLSALDIDIALIQQKPGVPDMVFTANAGLWYQNKIALPYFKYPERQKETQFFRAWFLQAGFSFLNDYNLEHPDIHHFEGAGDALLAGDKLFVGYGFRSDKAFYEEAVYFDQSKVIYCELVHPNFYHIDTCFCPLNEHQAIWYPDAFSVNAQKNMRQAIELIDVPIEEASSFACNAVVYGQHIVIPSDTPVLSKKLRALGMTVHHCEMTEYIKAGGACKCLTLRIG